VRGDLRAALEPAFSAGRSPRSWASPLAREIGRLLACEPQGLPLAELARRLRRREGDIRAELRDCQHFKSRGETKGRRWYLAPSSARWAGITGDPEAPAVPDTSEAAATAERLSAA
jgi:hypothetical protein